MTDVVVRQWSDRVFGVYVFGAGHHRLGDFLGVFVGPRSVVQSYADRRVRTSECCDGATVPEDNDTTDGFGSVRVLVGESVKAKPGRQPRGLAAAFLSDAAERSAVDDDVTR